jgi:hypothetical protein
MLSTPFRRVGSNGLLLDEQSLDLLALFLECISVIVHHLHHHLPVHRRLQGTGEQPGHRISVRGWGLADTASW